MREEKKMCLSLAYTERVVDRRTKGLMGLRTSAVMVVVVWRGGASCWSVPVFGRREGGRRDEGEVLGHKSDEAEDRRGTINAEGLRLCVGGWVSRPGLFVEMQMVVNN